MSATLRRLVLVVVGTRPEAIKLVPLILALRESEVYEPVVISTGQHYAMVGEVFELAGIRPDIDLWVGSVHSRLNDRVASVLRRFEDFVSTRFGSAASARRRSRYAQARIRSSHLSTGIRARRSRRHSDRFTCASPWATSRPACARAD